GIGTSTINSNSNFVLEAGGNSSTYSAFKFANLNKTSYSLFVLGETLGDAGTPFYIARYGSTHASKSHAVELVNTFNAPLSFSTNNIERLRILGNGNVGIGTNNPQSLLTVNGDIRADAHIKFGNPSSNNNFITGQYEPMIYGSTSGGSIPGSGSSSLILQAGSGAGDRHMYFRTSDETRLFIKSSGDVGIGTHDPKSRAHFVFNQNSTSFGTTTSYLVLSNSDITAQNKSGIAFSSNAAGLGTSLISAQHNRDTGNSGRLTFYTRNLSGNLAAAMTIDEKSDLGLGTPSPVDKLHLYRATGRIRQIIETNDNSTVGLHIKHNSKASTIGYLENSNVLKINNTDSFGDNHLVITETGKVGIGTNTPGDHHLAVNGTIKAKEVKVSIEGWSDFVFEESYSLPSLEEVESHIKEKGHLKDIPSAQEVEENGINLGEMDAKLLQKIEELTLYKIELKKENELLKKEINKLIHLNEEVKN
ncbi:MAG: tail fiber protein, partial [Bacteroidota bacterium]|nr:tail fiber protein [Bacteroidota bacterium]